MQIPINDKKSSAKSWYELTTDLTGDFNMLSVIIIYQSSKFSFSCVSLMESLSREIDEIKLSPSHQRERETMHYSPVNNEITCAIT